MEVEDSRMCRICLSTEASKDIADLECRQSGKTSSEIMFFCLNIQIKNDFNISTKLCQKCLRQITSFYNFKLLALKNDAYLKNLDPSLHIKSEIFLDEDLKNELSSHDSDVDEVALDAKLKQEPVKYENDSNGCQSDDEFLSEIKKNKNEHAPEAHEIKENKKNGLKANKAAKGQAKNSKSQETVCEECGKSVKNLREHVLRHKRHIDPSLRLPCSLCEKTFSSYDSRSKHRRITHSAEKKVCEICKKLVKSLKHHTVRMHNKKKRHKCVQCDKLFHSSSALRQHSVCHTDARPHTCDVCNKSFRALGNMIIHKRSVHEQERTRMCQYCSKSFTRDSHLTRHLRIHTKEKPYECKECGKAFNTVTILRNHMYVHSEKKAFVCEVCDKKFACPRYLSNHMVTHTREKRWQCRYCDMKFHRPDHRTQHEVAIHKIKKRTDIDSGVFA